jgi:signal transduction histidine kinase
MWAMSSFAMFVAHEINQPLTAISLSADAALRLLEESGKDVDEGILLAVLRVRAECQRASQILFGMRDLLNEDQPSGVTFDLRNVIDTVRRRIAPSAIKGGIKLSTEIPDVALEVHGVPIQIEQLLSNLVHNAIEAMEGLSSRREVMIAAEAASGIADIRVIDTGPGLTGSAAQRAFEPRFTTKPRGSGVGLSLCRLIAQRYGGALVCEPSEKGACFRITLPLETPTRSLKLISGTSKR